MRDKSLEDDGKLDAWERRQSQAIKDLAKRNALAKKLGVPDWNAFQEAYGVLLMPPIRAIEVYQQILAASIIAELRRKNNG